MKIFQNLIRLTLAAAIYGAAGVGTVLAQGPAEAVWHCSRANTALSQNKAPANEDNFGLASSGAQGQAIGISLLDLIDVYSNKVVQVSGRPLTACFLPGNSPLSLAALNALGLKAANMQLQARKSAIVQSKLQMVTDEPAMLACIAQNYPAVGYLSQSTETDQVLSCF